MKRILLCFDMFENVDINIKESKNPPSLSAHRFQQSIVDGFLENNIKVEIINAPLLRCFPNYKQLIFHKCDTDYKGVRLLHLPFCNLPGINYLSKMISSINIIDGIVDNKDDYLLIVYNSYLPQSVASLILKHKHKNIETCNIVADIHGKYGLATGKKGMKRLLKTAVEKLEDYFGSKHDSFVFLTEEMNTVFNKKNKPYTIVDGVYSCEEYQQIKIGEDNIILYAGAVREDYGIKHLLESFELIQDDSFKLWIAGGGDASDLVNEYATKDSRIKYYGYVSPQIVANLQEQARVLVNPRQNKHEFVKYSFPSKTMESLALGKPFVAHRLPCYGTEYDAHISYVDNDSEEALAKKLVEICGQNNSDILKKGMEAQSFIKTQKNEKSQVKKILDVILHE